LADIVISEFMDQEAVARLSERWSTDYDPTLVDQRELLAARLKEARALIVRNRTRVDRPLIEQAPRLRVVGRLGVGLDNIDLAACKERGITVCPARGANESTVAEYVITAALLLLRGAFQAKDAVIAGAWPREDAIGHEIAGKRLGLIGFGANARETAKRGLALGMHVAAYDPFVPDDDLVWGSVRPASLLDILRHSDVVSLHVPLTDATRRIIDRSAIAAMPPSAVLINAARGGLLDEEALVEALTQGHLAGAALDTFEQEPLDAETGRRFAGVPNLLLTPHIAGVTEESNRRVSLVTADNVARVLDSLPQSD